MRTRTALTALAPAALVALLLAGCAPAAETTSTATAAPAAPVSAGTDTVEGACAALDATLTEVGVAGFDLSQLLPAPDVTVPDTASVTTVIEAFDSAILALDNADVQSTASEAIITLHVFTFDVYADLPADDQQWSVDAATDAFAALAAVCA